MTRTISTETFDGVLIIGAGLAGLSAALAAAPRKALVLSAAPLLSGCSSAWAQGGVAAALSPDDDPALHAADTVAAGAGLVDPAMAELLTREGPDAVRRLAGLGAPFDRTPTAASPRAWRPRTAAPASPGCAATRPAARSCAPWPPRRWPAGTSRSAPRPAPAPCCRTPAAGCAGRWSSTTGGWSRSSRRRPSWPPAASAGSMR